MSTTLSSDADKLNWADGLLTTYSGRRAIVVNHDTVGTGNPAAHSTQGLAIFNALKNHCNLFLMLGGHTDGEGRRQDPGGGGCSNTVYSLLADYQGRTNGGNGWLRVLEFSPANNEIRVRTYSPTLNQWETDADSRFELPYVMSTSASFAQIGQPQTLIASGTNASVPWSGLANGTQYEWYVTVSDGTTTVTGPTWSFTTAASQATLTVTGPSSVTYGSTDTITTLGGSGSGAMSYATVSSTGCTVDPSTGVITVTDASGTCTVTATKAGDATYNPTTSASFPVTLNKGTQAAVTLSGVPGTATVGDTFTASAGGGSGGGGYSYAVTGTACTVDSSTGAGSVLHVSGGCSVTATRAADSDYNEATSAASAISSISKGTQAAVTLSGVPGTATVGDTFTASAGGGSGGGGYSYAVTGTACTVGLFDRRRLGAPCERRLFGHSHPGCGQRLQRGDQRCLGDFVHQQGHSSRRDLERCARHGHRWRHLHRRGRGRQRWWRLRLRGDRHCLYGGLFDRRRLGAPCERRLFGHSHPGGGPRLRRGDQRLPRRFHPSARAPKPP